MHTVTCITGDMMYAEGLLLDSISEDLANTKVVTFGGRVEADLEQSVDVRRAPKCVSISSSSTHRAMQPSMSSEWNRSQKHTLRFRTDG